jgi:Ca2+-binding EF-hand superfamily protein
MESTEEVCARTRRRICAAKNRRFKSWEDVFAKCDKDNSGYLDHNEFWGAIRQTLGVPENAICDYELRTLFNEMDADRSGDLNIEELLTYLTQGFRRPEEIAARAQVRIERVRKNLKQAFQNVASNEMSIRKLFKKLDFDGDNTLSLYEFKAFVRRELKLTFWDVNNTDVEDFFAFLDKDGGGTIDVDELIAFIKTTHCASRPLTYSFAAEGKCSGSLPNKMAKSMKKKTYKQQLLEDSFRSTSLPQLSRLPYTASVVSLGRNYAPTGRSALQLSAIRFFTPQKVG